MQGVALSTKELEELKEYAKTHKASDCAKRFNIHRGTVTMLLRKHYNIGCEWGLAIVDEEWENMRKLICAGEKLDWVAQKYGKGRSSSYVRNGLISRYGEDFKRKN